MHFLFSCKNIAKASKKLSIISYITEEKVKNNMTTDRVIIGLYANNLSLRAIQNKTGIHHLKVRKILIQNNVPRRERVEGLILSKQHNFPINDYMQDVIGGELLGDGHLKSGKHQSCFTYGSSQQEYVDWLGNIFKQNGIPLCGKGVYKTNTYDHRYNKTYTSYRFATLHSLEFYKLRNKWYRNNIKTLPKDFKLNNINILHWWIGDGSLNKKGNYAWVATDNFSKHEVNILSKDLQELGVKNWARRCSNKNKYVYRLYIPRTGVLDLLHIIGKSPVECYKYKWNCRG